MKTSLTPPPPSVEDMKLKPLLFLLALFTLMPLLFFTHQCGFASLLPTAKADIPLKVYWDFQDSKDHISKKQWSEATVLLQRVTKNAPQWTPGALMLAKVLTYSGRRTDAIQVLENTIQHEKGESRQALIRQTNVLSRIFYTQESSKIYQEGLRLVREKKYRLGRERLQRALEIESNNLEILLRLGQCFVLEGNVDSAAETLLVAKKLGPFEPEVHLWLARALHQRGELKKSLQEFHSIRDELKTSEIAPLWHAEAQVSAGQKNAAIQLLEKNTREHPMHLYALYFMALLKYQAFPREESTLWGVRKDLQLILSRLENYISPQQSKFESELGLDLRNKEFVQTETHLLLSRISAKLENVSGQKN